MSWEDWILDEEGDYLTVAHISELEQLLEISTLKYELYNFYRIYIRQVEDVLEYYKIKVFLLERLIDPIMSGRNYGQREIQRKLKKEIF